MEKTTSTILLIEGVENGLVGTSVGDGKDRVKELKIDAVEDTSGARIDNQVEVMSEEDRTNLLAEAKDIGMIAIAIDNFRDIRTP